MEKGVLLGIATLAGVSKLIATDVRDKKDKEMFDAYLLKLNLCTKIKKLRLTGIVDINGFLSSATQHFLR